MTDLAPGPLAVDRPYHLGVEAQAGVEGEVPVSGPAHADAAGPALGQGREDLPGRVDRIGGQAQGPGEDVGVAAGQRRERRTGWRRLAGAGAEMPLTASLTVPSPPSVSTSP